jgi:uncharacterized membrane protein
MKKEREFPTSLFMIGVSVTILIINLIVNMEEEKAMTSTGIATIVAAIIALITAIVIELVGPKKNRESEKEEHNGLK